MIFDRQKVRVELADAYPYKSPSIGFLNKIFHPNVDESSGSVSLDVINQSWSPMFDLLNVFEVFLPQLLLYPNPTDPLNGDAPSLMMKDKQQYEQKLRNLKLWFGKSSIRSLDSGSIKNSQGKGLILANGTICLEHLNLDLMPTHTPHVAVES
ncbi:hypothetical protein H6P81_011624 [Aristolochia fimbriata]|uniref:UBC core domain-containing protein n=1 Tax=Aristolochia fimbriata TaxID=158543 RepID=A0AAV7ETE0_ARIFI|nr:hypothetical protein H6P81_011624 [Aristolochia fimbriata]